MDSKTLRLLTLFLIVSFPALELHAKDAVNWSSYTSKQGNFSVMTPGEMVNSTQEMKTGFGPTVVHLATVEWNKTLFQVDYADFSPLFLELSKPEEFLEALSESLSRSGFKLAKKELSTWQDYPAIHTEYETMDGMKVIWSRSILVSHRLYRSTVIGRREDEKSLQKIRETFFNSIKIA